MLRKVRHSKMLEHITGHENYIVIYFTIEWNILLFSG